MNETDLPLQPEPTPEERREFEALSARLDEWAAEAAERVSIPVEAAEPDPVSGQSEPIDVRSRTPAWMRSPQVAAAVLAASVVGFLLLPDPGTGPVEQPAAPAVATGNALQAIDLEVASPHPYMIVPSSDPTISIVWLLDTDTNEGD